MDKRFDTFVFDLDGTLLDTLDDLAVLTNQVLREMGWPERSVPEILSYVGNGVRALMYQAVPEGTTPEDAERAMERWSALFPTYPNDLTHPYPGVVELLEGLRRRGCKVGVGDVLIGAAAVAADYNGAARASHIKDKLIEMTHLNETLYCCGIACSAEGHPTASGNYIIDLLLANVCKQNVTRFPYEIVRLAEDIAGGLMVTAPGEADFRDPKIGAYVEKYLKGVAGVSTENRLRILRLIENLSLGTAVVGYRTESLHGAGSPQAQRIMIARQGNLPMKKKLAKKLANIVEDAE